MQNNSKKSQLAQQIEQLQQRHRLSVRKTLRDVMQAQTRIRLLNQAGNNKGAQHVRRQKIMMKRKNQRQTDFLFSLLQDASDKLQHLINTQVSQKKYPLITYILQGLLNNDKSARLLAGVQMLKQANIDYRDPDNFQAAQSALYKFYTQNMNLEKKPLQIEQQPSEIVPQPQPQIRFERAPDIVEIQNLQMEQAPVQIKQFSGFQPSPPPSPPPSPRLLNYTRKGVIIDSDQNMSQEKPQQAQMVEQRQQMHQQLSFKGDPESQMQNSFDIEPPKPNQQMEEVDLEKLMQQQKNKQRQDQQMDEVLKLLAKSRSKSKDKTPPKPKEKTPPKPKEKTPPKPKEKTPPKPKEKTPPKQKEKTPPKSRSKSRQNTPPKKQLSQKDDAMEQQTDHVVIEQSQLKKKTLKILGQRIWAVLIRKYPHMTNSISQMRGHRAYPLQWKSVTDFTLLSICILQPNPKYPTKWGLHQCTISDKAFIVSNRGVSCGIQFIKQFFQNIFSQNWIVQSIGSRKIEKQHKFMAFRKYRGKKIEYIHLAEDNYMIKDVYKDIEYYGIRKCIIKNFEGSEQKVIFPTRYGFNMLKDQFQVLRQRLEQFHEGILSYQIEQIEQQIVKNTLVANNRPSPFSRQRNRKQTSVSSPKTTKLTIVKSPSALSPKKQQNKKSKSKQKPKYTFPTPPTPSMPPIRPQMNEDSQQQTPMFNTQIQQETLKKNLAPLMQQAYQDARKRAIQNEKILARKEAIKMKETTHVFSNATKQLQQRSQLQAQQKQKQAKILKDKARKYLYFENPHLQKSDETFKWIQKLNKINFKSEPFYQQMERQQQQQKSQNKWIQLKKQQSRMVPLHYKKIKQFQQSPIVLEFIQKLEKNKQIIMEMMKQSEAPPYWNYVAKRKTGKFGLQVSCCQEGNINYGQAFEGFITSSHSIICSLPRKLKYPLIQYVEYAPSVYLQYLLWPVPILKTPFMYWGKVFASVSTIRPFPQKFSRLSSFKGTQFKSNVAFLQNSVDRLVILNINENSMKQKVINVSEAYQLNQMLALRMLQQVVPAYIMRTPSKGWGLFAGARIDAYVCIGQYAGQIAQTKNIQKTGDDRALTISGTQWSIQAKYLRSAVTYANHSFTPNAAIQGFFTQNTLHYFLYALKRINVGQEITWDYGGNLKYNIQPSTQLDPSINIKPQWEQ